MHVATTARASDIRGCWGPGAGRATLSRMPDGGTGHLSDLPL